MSDNASSSSGKGSGGGRFLLSRRTVGILVMVAGAAAFIFSQVVFTDQVLFLLGSTLVVFLGLAIILTQRRSGSNSESVVSQTYQRQAPQPSTAGRMSGTLSRRRVPPGLREEVRRQAMARPAMPAPEKKAQEETPVSKIPLAQGDALGAGDLLGQVISLLDEQGAQVVIDTQREDAGSSRGILQVQSSEGLPYSVLVLESEEPVDVADVRALFALVTSSSSAGGYLVASAPFTQRAYDWAGARHIHLVREDELNEMSI